MKTVVWLLLVGLFLRCAVGQEATPSVRTELPSGAVLKRAPESAQWIVTHKVTGGQKDENGNFKPGPPNEKDFRAIFSKGNSVFHLEMTFGDGHRVDKWCLGEIQITKTPNARLPVISRAQEPDASFQDFSKGDFPDLAWVSPKNFVERRKVGNADCLIFRDRVRISDKVSVDGEAAIDATTRLPVSLVLDGALTTYEHKTPSAAITPPAEILSLAKFWTEKRRKASLLPPP
jgi:hypothetical protein